MTMLTIKLDEDTVLNTIDLNHPWFDQGVESGVAINFPGDAQGATMTPRQIHLLLSGFIARSTTDNGYMTSAIGRIHAAERRAERLTDRQWSLNLLTKYTEDANAKFVDHDVTDNQLTTVQQNLAALAGTEPHWDVTTNRNIQALDDETKMLFKRMWLKVETRGQFNTALKKFGALVGNPATRSRQNPVLDDVNNLTGDADAALAAANAGGEGDPTYGDEDPM